MVFRSSLPGDNSPLFALQEQRPHLVDEVCRRVFNDVVRSSRTVEGAGIEYVLNDAAYQEIERLKHERGPEQEIRSIAWWRRLSKRLATMSEKEKRRLLSSLIESYADDIAGQFSPWVYRMATRALPIGLSFLFKTQDLPHLEASAGIEDLKKAVRHVRDLSERVVLQGPTATLRKLSKKGTLVFVPTHSSNMDSILVGWSLYEAGLPPVTYGAGKNLFTNPLTSYFMNNLGAYKVDRRLEHDLYKRILKLYSQVMIEKGFHSLFFPGGTRCRSNAVEQQLKLGLLGTALTGYIHNLKRDTDAAPIYICPMTINYNLVLEANSLIEDHFRREGRGRYLLEDDEFMQIPTIARFVLKTMKMDSTTIIRFGQPLDPFGNEVRADGESYDRRGRRVSRAEYVRSAKSGAIVYDEPRDREYTRHAGSRIAESFLENTVLMPTQIVSWVLFERIQERFPSWDVYRLVRFGAEETVEWAELQRGVDTLLRRLQTLEADGDVVLSPFLHDHSTERIVEAGIDYLMKFHTPEVVQRWSDGIMVQNVELVYYYGNRVRSFEI